MLASLLILEFFFIFPIIGDEEYAAVFIVLGALCFIFALFLLAAAYYEPPVERKPPTDRPPIQFFSRDDNGDPAIVEYDFSQKRQLTQHTDGRTDVRLNLDTREDAIRALRLLKELRRADQLSEAEYTRLTETIEEHFGVRP